MQGSSRTGSGLGHSRPPYQQRNVGAVVIEPLLAAQQAAPVIAEEKDRRVVEKLLLLQLAQKNADLVIEQLYGIKVVRNLVANHRMVRVERRQFHLAGIDQNFLLARFDEGRAFVGRHKVHLSVKRLAGLTLVPVRTVKGFRRREVEVRLCRSPSRLRRCRARYR